MDKAQEARRSLREQVKSSRDYGGGALMTATCQADVVIRLLGLEASARLLTDGTVVVEIGCETRTLQNWRDNLTALLVQRYGGYSPEHQSRHHTAFTLLEQAIQLHYGDQIMERTERDRAVRQLADQAIQEYREDEPGYVGLRREGSDRRPPTIQDSGLI